VFNPGAPVANASLASNASVPGDTNINVWPTNTNLFNGYYDLTPYDPNTQLGPVWLGNHLGLNLAFASTENPQIWSGVYDGNNAITGRVLPAASFQQADMRQHPYFRSEWMQRVMNLTTVRTHQFAVWITVGLFEVTQAGDPQMAALNPVAAYDQLGLELGILEGTNTRYRGFFLLDRTRATGFNPTNPGDFRDVIVYRKTIE
jgi:hypothetical protein